MIDRSLSDEITAIFEYIRDVLRKETPHLIINEYAYMVAALNCEDSLMYQALSSIVMENTIMDMEQYFRNKLSYSMVDDANEDDPYSIFDYYIVTCDAMCKQFGLKAIDSSILLLSILKTNEEISKEMRIFSITAEQLFNCIKNRVTEYKSDIVETPKKHTKKKKNELAKIKQPIQVVNISPMSPRNGDVARNTINISNLASEGKVQHVVGYDKYYDEIFTILSKKNRNNVAVCGKHGVGKTATVKNIANIINEKKCNINFHNKVLVELDFSKLVVGTALKGAFEQKFYNMLEEAKMDGCYIFFIDNLNFLLDSSTRYSETDMETLLNALFSEPSVQTICTMTEGAYSSLQKNTILGKYFQNVIIEEPTEEKTIEILNSQKNQYEIYHDVFFDDEAVKACVSISKKYITKRSLPDSALDLMDSIGANVSLNVEENQEIKELKEELNNVIDEINELKSTSQSKQYDKIDELTKKQISIKSQIGIIEKNEILSREPKMISKKDVCSIMSEKLDIPLNEIDTNDKDFLRGLSNKLKNSVIGQDEAIDEVSRVVKRQRVGLGGNERPSVLMFLGSTGVGKTYLAKQLAKEVFGSDKYFVRMDMSEYSDKTSVNKISGSSPGYVGYDHDTFLVKELKKKKRFILLLDEFEKSDEEVHNLFLQMFDEGRFSDNHGNEYSLKDVIIILTSNVGVAEASNRGKSIGFGNTDFDFSKEIIEKEMKRKFKPEFLNRIQKIIYFNKLKDENLKSIIKLEIGKLSDKVKKIGYKLSNDLTETTMVDEIYNEISGKKEYGARPIVNEVQRRIEDKIVDYIIDNDVESGHTFTYNELSNLD